MTYPNLAPMKMDSVSFGAIKKSQIQGFDLACANHFKAPLEKFNSSDDLNAWAKERYDNEFTDKNYPGRTDAATTQRKFILRGWKKFLPEYPPAVSLLVMTSLVKDLKQDNDKLPPSLNSTVFKETVSQIEKQLNCDKSYTFDFNKVYQKNLTTFALGEGMTLSDETKWIKIPSKTHDPENFEKNVEKLRILSGDRWCTKSGKALDDLASGDFHVYLENGKPKVGIRFIGDRIREIAGERNDKKIPYEYSEIIKKYVDESGFSEPRMNVQINNSIIAKQKIEAGAKPEDVPEFNEELDFYKKPAANPQRQQAERNIEPKVKPKLMVTLTKPNANLDTAKVDLAKAIEAKDYTSILSYFGIKTVVNRDGTFTLSEFYRPRNVGYSDLGIVENELLTNVSQINGDAIFEKTDVTDLGNLKSIRGNANFLNCNISNLGNLETIEGFASFGPSVKDLGELKSVGGHVSVGSGLRSLGKLETIGKSLYTFDGELTDLGLLKSVGEDAYLTNSKVENLGNLERIARNAHFGCSEVRTLNNLMYIGGDVDIINSKLSRDDFRNLTVGCNIYDGKKLKVA